MSDITLHVTDREGAEHSILAPTDMNMNVMEALKANDFPIQAVCGGMAMCATCQCYIESDHELPEMSYEEDVMLEDVYMLRKDNSRLTCQLPVTEELNELKLTIAPEE
jgi:ferredoxin